MDLHTTLPPTPYYNAVADLAEDLGCSLQMALDWAAAEGFTLAELEAHLLQLQQEG